MSDFDYERVSALLNIVAQCLGHSGKLGALSNEAMHELLEANGQVHEKAMARKKKAEADAAEKKQVEVKRVAEVTQKTEAQRKAEAQREAEQVEVTGDPQLEPVEEPDEEPVDGTIKPSVFPRDSNTATIADNNVPRRV